MGVPEQDAHAFCSMIDELGEHIEEKKAILADLDQKIKEAIVVQRELEKLAMQVASMDGSLLSKKP